MHEVATLCHTVNFSRQLREKVMQAKPAQYSSVDEAILFGGYIVLAGLKVRMADHSNRVHRLKLVSAYGLWINFELQLYGIATS